MRIGNIFRVIYHLYILGKGQSRTLKNKNSVQINQTIIMKNIYLQNMWIPSHFYRYIKQYYLCNMFGICIKSLV